MKAPVNLWDRLAPLSDALLRATRAERRLPSLFTRIQLAFLQLEGPSADSDRARKFIRDSLSKTLLAILLATGLGLALQDQTLLLACVVLACFLPVMLFTGLNKRILFKKRSIVAELPELLNQLVLLVNAGETVQQALAKCGGRISRDAEEPTPLQKELLQLMAELNNQISLPVGLDNFSKRCGVQEVSLFSNTILLNYRRGGDDFVTSLRELNRGLWERRKAQAKILGEEASSKLVFPMVMIFLIVTIIVAAPAILMMGEF
ncbi:type II secretion system F family protein [Gorillibacterium timonense]|uniref:type II secretion system F family protein n=1 Tax=Gorillibacterium timonense TaxID=1689269 RepID=UPI00071E07BB|nr:type II secretion system F family protein [Gorillibacterium timonense]